MIRSTRLLLMLAMAISPAFGSGLDFKGLFFSDQGIYHYHASEGDDEVEYRGLSSLRLSMLNRDRQHGKFECNVDFSLPHGHYLDLVSMTGADTSSTASVLPVVTHAPVLMDLRKLYLTIFLPFADITLGRQIINFGKGTIFSPIDVFSTVELQDLAFRRTGSDIAMAAIPLSDRAGVDIVTGLPLYEGSTSTALRGYATLSGWDLSMVGIYRNLPDSALGDDALAGIAFKGDVMLGLYGEAVACYRDKDNSIAFETMAGVDYSVRDLLFFMAEYLYRSVDRSGIWGKHTAQGTAQWKVNDLTSLTGTMVRDFSRDRSMGILQFSYNIVQNADAIVYVRGYQGSSLYDAEYAVRAQMKF